MIGIFAFYLGCNFVVIVIPAVAYAAWLGDAVSRGLLALALVDYAVPLRPGRPWVAWCELTRVAEGIRSYFDAECVIEGDFRRDRSHLIVSHPHGLFGAGYGLYAHELRERFGMKPLFTGADVVFMLPLLRRIMVWWGMTMVSAAPLRRALSQPWPYNAVQLQPGGIAEMFYGTDCEQSILSKRKVPRRATPRPRLAVISSRAAPVSRGSAASRCRRERAWCRRTSSGRTRRRAAPRSRDGAEVGARRRLNASPPPSDLHALVRAALARRTPLLRAAHLARRLVRCPRSARDLPEILRCVGWCASTAATSVAARQVCAGTAATSASEQPLSR